MGLFAPQVPVMVVVVMVGRRETVFHEAVMSAPALVARVSRGLFQNRGKGHAVASARDGREARPRGGRGGAAGAGANAQAIHLWFL